MDEKRGAEKHFYHVQLLEVVLDLGRIPIARFPTGDVRLSEEAVSHADLEAAVALVHIPAPASHMCLLPRNLFPVPATGLSTLPCFRARHT